MCTGRIVLHMMPRRQAAHNLYDASGPTVTAEPARPRFGPGRPRTLLVSASPADSTAAEFVVFQLQRAGHLVLIDRSDNDSWGGRLLDALWRCDAVIVVVSSAATTNPRVRREVMAAGAERVPLLSVMIEPADFEPDMAWYLLRRRSVDVRFDAERGATELLGRLEALPRRLIRRPRWFASRLGAATIVGVGLLLGLRWLFGV